MVTLRIQVTFAIVNSAMGSSIMLAKFLNTRNTDITELLLAGIGNVEHHRIGSNKCLEGIFLLLGRIGFE